MADVPLFYVCCWLLFLPPHLLSHSLGFPPPPPPPPLILILSLGLFSLVSVHLFCLNLSCQVLQLIHPLIHPAPNTILSQLHPLPHPTPTPPLTATTLHPSPTLTQIQCTNTYPISEHLLISVTDILKALIFQFKVS